LDGVDEFGNKYIYIAFDWEKSHLIGFCFFLFGLTVNIVFHKLIMKIQDIRQKIYEKNFSDVNIDHKNNLKRKIK
jgi:uncharacterized membrane protein YagU involved in acid resistance